MLKRQIESALGELKLHSGRVEKAVMMRVIPPQQIGMPGLLNRLPLQVADDIFGVDLQ